MFGSTVPTPARVKASRALAGLALGAGLSVLLVGCGSSDAPANDTESTRTESSAATNGEDSGTTEEETSTEAGGSEVSVTVDGEAVDIADPMAVCQEDGDTMTIAVGSASGTDGIGAVLAGGDSPTVTSVALGSMDGTAMGWAEGAPGEASATKDGNTYTITGSMMAVDPANPTAPAEKAFEMQITCP